ncbi:MULTISPECIES: hypothetical protein [unclassified Ekhidna]|jgi:hypothetical protein|uniref:hypothetical protein n=1 Tax=unclassified Ekhidna TaxID=2632188 RepID=UPI0032DE96B7
MRQNLVILFLLGAFFFSCDQEKEPQPAGDVPTVSQPTITSEWTSQNSGQVEVASTVLDDGGLSVTERGFIYSTSSNPEWGKSGVQATGVGSSFEGRVIGLYEGNIWYMRAYAKNEAGYGYSSQITIDTN